MDQPSKPSFADDPRFIASLPDLDSGLGLDGGDLRPARRTSLGEEPRYAEPHVLPQPPLAPRPMQAPRSLAPQVSTGAAAPVSAVTLPDVQPPQAGGRRRLLDLFPPPPSGAEDVPNLPIGIAEPPRLALRGAAASPPTDPKPSASPVTYETFYGLSEKPFTLSTDPKFLYHSTAHDQAAQALLSAIRRRDGLVVLTGEIGVGKTTMCRVVTEELDRRTLTSVVVDPFVSLSQLLQTVLVDFGVVSRDDVARGRLADASSKDLIAKLRAFVASLVQLQAFAVIIIDEAHTIPVADLEAIGELMDPEGQQRLLQIILVGQPSLLKLLGRGDLKSLRQRIAVRSELKPLAHDEIVGYVMHRLAVAGPQARVEFDDPAFERLYFLTGGVPRLVNLICDRVLTLGHGKSASVIDETLILTAAHDLDIVPPEPRQRRLLRAALTTIVVVLLMGVGAAAAAWVFREPLGRMIEQWQIVPTTPRAPATTPAGQRAPQ